MVEVEMKSFREIEEKADTEERKELFKKLLQHTVRQINSYLDLFVRRTSDGVKNSLSEYFLFLSPETNKMVGIGALRNKSINEKKYLVEIRHIIVEPDCRNQGFSKLIVSKLVENAKKQGYRKATATSRKANRYIEKTFLSNDFIKEGVLREHFDFNRDLNMWGKILS